MPTTPSPPDREPAEPELSLEPVMGWRVWRLVFSNGRYRLRSLNREMLWEPGEVFRATCARQQHPAPEEGCRCGVYGVSSLRRLARSGVLYPGVNVVGVIAMWGRVIEHQHGARSALAYPARLRLVCGRCLSTRRGAVEAVAVLPDRAFPIPVCRRHLADGQVGLNLDEVHAQLLDDYGIELLPMAKLSREFHHPLPIEPILRAFDTRPRPSSVEWSFRRLISTALFLVSFFALLAALLSATFVLAWAVSGWS